MRKIYLVGVTGACLAAAALAQTNVADVIKERQAGMKVIGSGFKGLMDQTRGTPDPAAVKRHAAAVAAMSPKVTAWFAPGTAAPAGTKTGARPEVWTQQAAFRKSAAGFDAQAKRVLALANAGDMDAFGPQVRALGGTCKDCHDQFRQKDD